MKRPTRRHFLQQAGAVAAASAIAPSLARASSALSTSAQAPAVSQPLSNGWEFVRMPLAGPWEAWSDQPLAPWTAVSLPHCYNSYDGCDPDTPAYRGKGWYRRHLNLANPFPSGRTLLHFGAAGQSSEIYIGDTLAGRHVGGYDEFLIDITQLAADPSTPDKSGTRLSVLCDNSPDMDRMPSDLSDFTLYGGIYRDVHLVYVPAVSLECIHVRVDAGAGRPARVKVEGRLHNPDGIAGRLKVDVAVTDPSGVEVHRSSEQQTAWTATALLASFELESPRLWAPATPHLYKTQVTVTSVTGMSMHTERFGVRFFEFKEKGPFFLNGERLLIQGTHRHEDHAGYAAAMPANLVREEMHLIKDMGAHFIRLAHYQQQKLVLDLCDELGLMVWEEVPWCRAGVGTAAFRHHGREKLSAMIDQHINHPSILCWGLGNEDDWEGEFPAVDEPAIRSYMQELHALAHQLDDSRVTSYRRATFADDIPDVYSPSIWAGWYGGRFIDYEKSLTDQRDKNKKMLHVEWGADSHARRHAEEPYKTLQQVATGDTAETGMAFLLEGGTPRVSRDGDWSETYACDLFDWHLKVQQSLPWLSGAVQWIFKDFTTPLRVDSPIPRVNQKGVVERDLTKKESFYVFQSYWAQKPMVRVYGHTWPTRWGHLDQPRRVRVYSNCPSVELFLNNVSLGTRKRDIHDFPCAGLRWDTPFSPGRNELRAVATTAAEDKVIDQISFLYEPEPWGPPARLELRLIERKDDGTLVEAALVDAKGHLCLEARNIVRFGVAGFGSLIDNRGTSTGSRVTQLCNGRAQIRIFAKQGEATASVISKGIPPAFCNL